MAQMLLFPDPRPIVERLGTDFFRSAPEEPGVYLMRDRAGIVVYVGKAKNLRKRLASYRVANPERMRRRHLRLLHTVERIELKTCENETAAIAKEAALLRSLRPRFNRAGTWPGKPKWVGCRCSEMSLEFSVSEEAPTGWGWYGPLGSSAYVLRGGFGPSALAGTTAGNDRASLRMVGGTAADDFVREREAVEPEPSRDDDKPCPSLVPRRCFLVRGLGRAVHLRLYASV